MYTNLRLFFVYTNSCLFFVYTNSCNYSISLSLSLSFSPSLSLISIFLSGVSNRRFRPCTFLSNWYRDNVRISSSVVNSLYTGVTRQMHFKKKIPSSNKQKDNLFEIENAQLFIKMLFKRFKIAYAIHSFFKKPKSLLDHLGFRYLLQ